MTWCEYALIPSVEFPLILEQKVAFDSLRPQAAIQLTDEPSFGTAHLFATAIAHEQERPQWAGFRGRIKCCLRPTSTFRELAIIQDGSAVPAKTFSPEAGWI